MEIVELHSLTDMQVSDVKALMKELASDIVVSDEALYRVVASPFNHLFAALDKGEHIVGCATLCVFDSPTGRKASVEDVVVLSTYRGQGLGKRMMEHLIDYSHENFGDIDLHLTSHPTRVAANALYRSLGFEKRDTNFYRMKINHS